MSIIKPIDVLKHLNKKLNEDSTIKRTADDDVLKHFTKKVYPRLEQTLNRQLQSEKFEMDKDGNLSATIYLTHCNFFNMKYDHYNVIRSYRFSTYNHSEHIKLSSNFYPLSKDSLFYMDLISPFIHKVEDAGYLVSNIRASNIYALNSINLSLKITIPKGE